MSDMIERAAKALVPYLERGAERVIASEVLAVALDPEDEALVEAVAEGMELDENFGSTEHMARAAIRAIKAMSQGESRET